jgi:hypothetical protein
VSFFFFVTGHPRPCLSPLPHAEMHSASHSFARTRDTGYQAAMWGLAPMSSSTTWPALVSDMLRDGRLKKNGGNFFVHHVDNGTAVVAQS